MNTSISPSSCDQSQLSDDQLAEIQARVDDATPGPWRWNGNGSAHDVWLFSLGTHPFHDTVLTFRRWGMTGAQPVFNSPTGLLKAATDGLLIRPESHNPWKIVDIDHPDAQFIAHSRADVDALLAEVKRLRALIDDTNEAAG